MTSYALNCLIFLFTFNLIVQTYLEETKLDPSSSITFLNILFLSNEIISLCIVLIYCLLYLELLTASLYVQGILMPAISSAGNTKVIKANSSLVKLTCASIAQIIFASLSFLITLSSSLLHLAFSALVKYYRADYKEVRLDIGIIS